MRIVNVEVLNYRLISNESISFENDVTLIVGRNNSGKSSLADLFIDFFERKEVKLDFFDFSSNCYDKFQESYEHYEKYQKLKEEGGDEKEQAEERKKLEDILPKIELKITINYEKDVLDDDGKVVESGDDLSALSNFIMDLDVDKSEALVSIEYSSNDTINLFKSFEEYLSNEDNGEAEEDNPVLDTQKALLKFLEENSKKYYSIKLYKVDLENDSYKELVKERKLLDDVFLTRSIVAQRSVDDNSNDNKKALGCGFERYYKNTNLGDDKEEKINNALKGISETLDQEYGDLFESVLTDLQDFGAEIPNRIPDIKIKSILNSEKILKDNIRYFYSLNDDVHFPENYNGLGYSNLIYMLLQFASFFEEFKNREPRPNFLFLVLEEPEAHMHPQMQQVFIKSVSDFLKKKDEEVQLIITTHSSHILAESGINENGGFNRVRYFDNSNDELTVRDLSQLVIEEDREVAIKFLKQYLTLHKCDIFFADKVILVEGVTERILLPLMIKSKFSLLHSQYLSIIEVGGAYANKFKELLEFLNVKTLIITDIDSVNASDRKKCPVSDGGVTSNTTLENWIPGKESVADLLVAGDDEKTLSNIRVSYQIPEQKTSVCGRSFEEAFILKNTNFLIENKDNISLVSNCDDEDIKNLSKAYDIAPRDSKRKTTFAFDLNVVDGWEIPLYINEGLEWLESDSEESE